MRNLTDLYRPKRFEDVVGQDDAKRYLAGLVRAGKIVKNILLFGAVGSGKTSMARIYAQALNCVAPNPATGSPCQACHRCLDSSLTNLIEHDTPRGRELESVERAVARSHVRGTEQYPRVVLLDEAHTLSSGAGDYLLKTLEDDGLGMGPTAFVFATTDPDRLQRAIISRVKRLHVAELDLAEAHKLLSGIAIAEGLELEPGVIEMIFRAAGGQPRDLLQTLDTVRKSDERLVPLERVKEIFGYDLVDTLEEFFVALGSGDFVRQSAILTQWRLPVAGKVEWIQAYLLSFYARTIRGTMYSTDPVVDYLTTRRAEVLGKFLERYGLKDPAELAPSWRAMMEALHGADRSSSADVATVLTLLQESVNQGAMRLAGTVVRAAPLSISNQVTLHGEFRPHGFVTLADIRKVYDAASALVQTRGIYLNLMLEIEPGLAGVTGESAAVAHIDQLVGQVAALVDGQSINARSDFAAVRLVENTPGGPVGYVAMHVPSVDHADDSELAPLHHVRAWVRHRRDVNLVRSRGRGGASVHWHFVRQMVRGYYEETAQEGGAIRTKLGLGKQRMATLLAADPIRLFGSLSPDVLTVGKYTAAPLPSRFDTGRPEVYSDWEATAYREQSRLLRRSRV